MGETDSYSKLIFENLEKGYQYNLTLSNFRDVDYLHVRKYFLSYEGEWVPSKEGASIPATISNTFALLDGLLDICSKQEGKSLMLEYLTNKISDLT